MVDDDLNVLRAALVARLDQCWDRLCDAASEIHAAHGVATDEIIDRVKHAVAESRGGDYRSDNDSS